MAHPATATSSETRAVRIACPAKINLHLRVGPRREDGFHSLLTWMCTVGLFDMLTLKTSPDRTRSSDSLVRLQCEPPTLPCDDRNLVFRVLRAWGDERPHGKEILAIAALLVKQTPIGAGLGGGSSDAAGALMAAEYFGGDGSPTPIESLAAVAGRFGSDIPFFLYGPSSVCTGRGEIVRPIPPPMAKAALLFLPPIAMPTPAVYQRFDAMALGREEDITREPDWLAWSRLPAETLMQRVVNDLEAPAFAIRPELAALREEAERSIRRIVRMSGSGSSLFTLFDREDEATEEAARLNRDQKMAGVRIESVSMAPRMEVVRIEG